MSLDQEALDYHSKGKPGKIEITSLYSGAKKSGAISALNLPSFIAFEAN